MVDKSFSIASLDEPLVAKYGSSEEQPSLSTCTFNLVLSSVGVGALTMPWTTATLGWLQLSALLLVVFFVSVYNLFLLDSACRAMPTGRAWSSYGGLVAATLGSPGAYALEAFTLLYSFGLSVTYFGVVGDQLSALALKLVANWSSESNPALSPWLLRPDVLMTIAILCIVLPLSFLSDKWLRLTGVVGSACMLFTTLVIIGSAPWRAPPALFDACAGSSALGRPGLAPVAWVSSLPALLDAVPMLTFCLNAATAFVTIRAQLQPPGQTGQPPRGLVASMIWGGQLLALVDYALASAAGYLTFCGAVPDNVLDAYPTSHLLALAARLALAVQLCLACAGVYVPLARASLWRLLRGIYVEGEPFGASCGTATALLLVVMLAAAVALGGLLALPLGLISAVCTTAIMFVFPGLCSARLQASPSGKCGPVLFALSGLVVGSAATLTLLVQASEGH
mmetsp:Transcript_91538/g.296123  ORF Transcript_91538/g.296123 Transcript_91538/m.296123 type:complete len:452 (+) Transcript_91538:47-1402(+)